MPVKLCLHSHCDQVVTPPALRCPEHARQARRGQRSVNNAFYASPRWRRARSRYLLEHTLCEQRLDDGTTCGVVATDVHHIQPLTAGGARFDPANMRALCHAHHTRLHRAGEPD